MHNACREPHLYLISDLDPSCRTPCLTRAVGTDSDTTCNQVQHRRLLWELTPTNSLIFDSIKLNWTFHCNEGYLFTFRQRIANQENDYDHFKRRSS